MNSPEVKPLRWGWIAVLHCPDGGKWYRAADAAAVVGVAPRMLRWWADRALISMIFWGPKQRRLYYVPELVVVVALAGGVGRARTGLLLRHIEAMTWVEGH